MADVDGDGDLDVLVAAFASDLLAWYENLGGSPPSFAEHILSIDPDGIQGNGHEGVADGARVLEAADLNHDGHMDFISAASINDRLSWWENDGFQNFTRRDLDGFNDSAVDIIAADINGDGDLDIVGASEAANQIAWHENNGEQPPDLVTFTEHVFENSSNNVFSIYCADIDRDGDIDVLSGVLALGRVDFWENIGDGAGFVRHLIDSDAPRVMSVYAADLNGDGEVDLLSASETNNTLAWYKSNGARSAALLVFDKRVISSDAANPIDVFAADIDGDGDLDVLAASLDSDTVAWYENEGGDDPSFAVRHVISSTADGAHGVYAADLDGDGDMDVLSVEIEGGRVVWYEQVDPCPADLDGDGDVDVDDFFLFLDFFVLGCG